MRTTSLFVGKKRGPLKGVKFQETEWHPGFQTHLWKSLAIDSHHIAVTHVLPQTQDVIGTMTRGQEKGYVKLRPSQGIAVCSLFQN